MATPLRPNKLSLVTIKSILAGYDYHYIKQHSPFKIDVLVPKARVKAAIVETELMFIDFNPVVRGNVIEVKPFTITIKDYSRFTKMFVGNKGLKAEERFFNAVKTALKEQDNKPLHIRFYNGRDMKVISNVIKITDEGAKGTKKDGVGTGKKADFHLHLKGGTVVPISLKGASGDQLQSADTYWREKAIKVIQWAVKKKKSKLVAIGPDLYKLDPVIAIEATDEEIHTAAFGTDCKYVIKGDMKNDAFDYTGSELMVKCSQMYTSVRDFKTGDNVWVQLRNDKSRVSARSTLWNGIRITIVQDKNVRGAVLKITRTERSQIGV